MEISEPAPEFCLTPDYVGETFIALLERNLV